MVRRRQQRGVRARGGGGSRRDRGSARRRRCAPRARRKRRRGPRAQERGGVPSERVREGAERGVRAAEEVARVETRRAAQGALDRVGERREKLRVEKAQLAPKRPRGLPRGRQRHEVHGTAGQKHHLVTRAEGDGTEGFGTPLAVAVAGGGGGGARGGGNGGERRGESREGSDVAVPGVDGFPGVGEDEEVFASGEPTRVGVGLVGAAPGGMPTPRRFGRGRMRSGGGGGSGDGVRLGDCRRGGGGGVVQGQARWIGGDDSRSASAAVIVDRGRKRASRPSRAPRPSRAFRARARRVDHGRGVIARRRGGVARRGVVALDRRGGSFRARSRRGRRRARDDGNLHHTRGRRATRSGARETQHQRFLRSRCRHSPLVASSSVVQALVVIFARLFRRVF